MAKKRKKISRKQLLKEPDEFLSFSRRLFQFVVGHYVQISVGLGIFFAVILTIAGIQYFSERSETQASERLGQAMTKYETAMKDNDAEKAYAEVQADFQKIIDGYSGKDAGKLAGMVYAAVCYQAGETDKAIELYEKALQELNEYSSLKTQILNGLAYAYEAKKDYKTAVSYFEQIASGTGTVMKDEALFNLGRLYSQMGEAEKSLAAYKKIVSDYSDSVYIDLAKEKVAS
jgi:tetratricopeptide (TPR) repeat protein